MAAEDPLQVVRFPMLELPPQAQQLELLPQREVDFLQVEVGPLRGLEVVGGPLRALVDPSR